MKNKLILNTLYQIVVLVIVLSCISGCYIKPKHISNGNTQENHYVYKNGFINHENTLLSDYKNVSKKFVSSDCKYTAVTSGNSEYLLIFKDGKEIFRYKWNELQNIFSWSDTIRIEGWNSKSNLLWFISWTPTNIAYIANVDLDNKQCNFYESPRLDRTFYYYNFDFDKGIFYYSDKYPDYDEEGKQENKNKKYQDFTYEIDNHQIY